jgi:hypothetical protein
MRAPFSYKTLYMARKSVGKLARRNLNKYCPNLLVRETVFGPLQRRIFMKTPCPSKDASLRIPLNSAGAQFYALSCRLYITRKDYTSRGTS